MIPLGMVLTWGGYAVGSWGYILVRGWNITLREWFSPLHPYQWPDRGNPPAVPKGHMFPTAQAGTSATGSGGQGARAEPGTNTA